MVSNPSWRNARGSVTASGKLLMEMTVANKDLAPRLVWAFEFVGENFATYIRAFVALGSRLQDFPEWFRIEGADNGRPSRVDGHRIIPSCRCPAFLQVTRADLLPLVIKGF